MTFGWRSATVLQDLGRKIAYNVTSLPEQLEVFHDYHQHDSLGRQAAEQTSTRRLNAHKDREGEREEGGEDEETLEGKKLTFLRPVLGVQDR